MVKRLTNGIFQLTYDEKIFCKTYNWYSNQINYEIKNFKKITQYHQELDRLKQIAEDISNGRYENIFKYLQLPKNGRFSKKNSIVLATSQIKFFDGYVTNTVCLTMKPIVFYNKKDYTFTLNNLNAYLVIEDVYLPWKRFTKHISNKFEKVLQD